MDPDGLKACLEQWNYYLCRYGGTYEDGVLECFYISDQCYEGMDFPYTPMCP